METLCQKTRGYDTDVIIRPKAAYNEGRLETHRTVVVTCTYHNYSVSKTFTTKNLKDTSELQKQAFDKCTKDVQNYCHEQLNNNKDESYVD